VKTAQNSGPPKKLVAIVTPVARFPLTADEEVSMLHLRKHLGAFDRYIIGQHVLPREFSDFTLKRFPRRYFTDRFAYNRLMLKERFYRAFAEYEYILIYQLDCLVFSSNLEQWCHREWDYVGAPWLKTTDDPGRGFSAVGNGGLSLRRVSSALEVLQSTKVVEDPAVLAERPGERSKFVHEALKYAPLLKRMFARGKGLLHGFGYHNNARWIARQMVKLNYHEDYFWAFEAPKVIHGFRIPVPREALAFSFECAPAYCFAENSGRLPFGCHAWNKHDPKFWNPFLLGQSDVPESAKV
jgi:Protein of unknown function (DUF5672)